MPTLQITPKGASSPLSVQVDEIASSLPKARGDAQGNTSWPPNVPTPGSAADAAADAALMSQGSPQGSGGAAQPWLNDPVVPQGSGGAAQPSADQPWLNAPIVKRAPGAHPDEPWLDAPIVTPAGSGEAGAPWLNDPVVGPKDTSYGSAFQQGLHDAASGLGATLGVLSGDVGWKGGQAAGQALQNAIPAPSAYQSASSDIVSKLKAGKLLAALGDLPRAAVEGAPAVAGGLATGAAGAAALPEALLGGAGAALGAGAYGALSSFGQDAQARAAANGHAQPTAGDQLAAAPTALAQGGLNAVGLGKVPGVSALIARSPAVLRGLTAGGVDAAGQAASNVVGQVGTTAGTTRGLTVEPDQVAAAALQGAAGRAGMMATGQAVGGALRTAGGAASAVGGGIQALGMHLAAKDLPAMSDDQAASFTRINNAYDQQAPSQPNASPTARMNALGKMQAAALKQVVSKAIATGEVDDSTGAALQTALQQAAVHKSALDTNLLNKLNSSTIDPELATTLRNGLMDLDNLSTMVNYKQASGPFAALGAKLASVAAPIAAVATGHPIEAGLLALGKGSHGVSGQVGSLVGGVLDRVAGTNLPQSLILRSQALKQAQAAGMDTSADAVSPVSSAYDALNALQVQQGQAASNADARARAARLQEAAANQVNGMAYRNSPEGIIARANMATRKQDILTQAAMDGRLQQPMSPDELGRVSVGLPARDPVPVNVPLGANNQPLVQAAPGAPQGARPVAPQGRQQPVPLQAAPAAPGGAPQAGSVVPVGWLSHFHQALGNAGIPATTDNVGKALGGAVASGRISQEYADWLLSNPSQFLGDRSVPFQHLVAQAMQNNGMEPRPVTEPVRHPMQWQSGAANARGLGTFLQGQAAEMGDLPLQIAVARIMATSSAQQKRDIEAQELAQRQHDVVALARAKQIFVPELFKGK